MWLPAPIYERLPQIWFLIGLGFFAFGVYLGFDYELIYGYFGIGVMCIVYSIWLLKARRKHREDSPHSDPESTNKDSDNVTAN